MSCCGRGPTTPGGVGSAGRSREVGLRTFGSERRGRPVYLEYTGPTYLTAIGPFSGRSYHFASTGAVLAVDPRDQRSLEAISGLRHIRAEDRA
jgi:hypothetical protein